ncbi:hypothetical protein BGZ47_010602, partial [Haplosporangium gracile]
MTAATATATATATTTTAAIIRTSVDLSTLLTVPTKIHVDRMDRDERFKILASLQLAIERAQAYRDELLQQDAALLSGGNTTVTPTQFTYQQQTQTFQDYQNSYIDKDTNHQHHQLQLQLQQQQQ